MKRCIVESQYGIKISKIKVVNPNVPVDLNPREILTLLKRNKIKVFHLDGTKKVRLNISNYNKSEYQDKDVVSESTPPIIGVDVAKKENVKPVSAPVGKSKKEVELPIEEPIKDDVVKNVASEDPVVEDSKEVVSDEAKESEETSTVTDEEVQVEEKVEEKVKEAPAPRQHNGRKR